jgi:hypothetical protein
MIALATDADFLAFYGVEPPPTWLGMAYRESERIIAMGVVIWNEHGAATGFFDRKGPVAPIVAHRTARRVMDVLKRVGEPAIYVLCDATVPRSALWLERLGFKPMDDQIWRADLA